MADYSSVIQQIYNATTLSQISDIVGQYSAAADGPGGILYSGPVGDVESTDVALQLAEATGLPILNNTPRGELLGDISVKKAIQAQATELFGDEGQSARMQLKVVSAENSRYGADAPIFVTTSKR